MPLLLVYGTLKQDKSNHYKLATSKFIGEATSLNSYLLLKTPRLYYPLLVDVPVAPITGELYEVLETYLPELDAFEGHPNLFERKLIQLQDGKEAWCYFYKQLYQISEF